jgi:alcohol dehydrogenase class IV
MEVKAEREAARLAPIARRLGLADETMPDYTAAVAAARAAADLVRNLELPQRLRDVGVPQTALPLIAAEAKADFPDEEGVDRILELAW